MNILVFDVGQSIIGIQRSQHGRYIPYYGDDRIKALERLEKSDQIVTFNGNRYDIDELNKLSMTLRGKEFKPPELHFDMSEIYWPNILGSSLINTFSDYFESDKKFPDTYEGSNAADVYMTLMLFRRWKDSLVTEKI